MDKKRLKVVLAVLDAVKSRFLESRLKSLLRILYEKNVKEKRLLQTR